MDIKDVLEYDPTTGNFTWLKDMARLAKRGSIAGKTNSYGYISIKVFGKDYLAHRLAWVFVHGYPPPDCIDHINRVRSDNRIANLRLATRNENPKNASLRVDNKTGHSGVWYYPRKNRYRASIRVDGKTLHLGQFMDKQDAVSAYQLAKEKYHSF